MKKIFLTMFTIFLITLISCAGASKNVPESVAVATPTPEVSYAMTLDVAIKEASDQIDKLFEANSKIALVNFDSPSDKFSNYVLDELTANLVTSRKLEVIDRKEVELRRGELNFQMSGEVDDNSIQELGRTLGAKNIVSGSLTILGDVHRIVIRALNVETGRVEVQYRNNIANDEIVMALLDNAIYTTTNIDYNTEVGTPEEAEIIDLTSESVPEYASKSASWEIAAWLGAGMQFMMDKVGDIYGRGNIYESSAFSASLGAAFFHSNLDFLRFGFNLDYGFLGIDNKALKKAYPEVLDSASSVATIFKANGVLRLQPVDFFFLSGGAGISYFGSDDFETAFGESIKGESTWAPELSVGAGFIISDFYFIEGQYHIVPFIDRQVGYVSVRLGLTVDSN